MPQDGGRLLMRSEQPPTVICLWVAPPTSLAAAMPMNFGIHLESQPRSATSHRSTRARNTGVAGLSSGRSRAKSSNSMMRLTFWMLTLMLSRIMRTRRSFRPSLPLFSSLLS